jgi:hypothetical protein
MRSPPKICLKGGMTGAIQTREPAVSDEVALEAHEHSEHAEHVAHSGDSFLRRVSITIAVLAVGSAAVSSLEANESAAAIASASEAVLHQDKATDQWAYYQAKGIKADLFALSAEHGGPKAAEEKAEADHEKKEQGEIRDKAQEEEKSVGEASAAQGRHEHRHHMLGFGETLSHVAIAIATIAIITRQRWPWATSIALGVAAAVMASVAYL